MEIAALLCFLALAWFWTDSMRAREVALDAGRRACAEESVQFLDWTVALKKLRLGRDNEGQMCIQRTYEFEFSDTGNNRLHGTVTLLGQQLLMLDLPVIRSAPSSIINLH
jgi:Protein of unknown function (DUF3301)